MNAALDSPGAAAHAQSVRCKSSRILPFLTGLCFVAAVFVHTSHAHEASQASTLHPACTICQFHAPVADAGNALHHVAEPDPWAHFQAQSPETRTPDPSECTHASRAPPSCLPL